MEKPVGGEAARQFFLGAEDARPVIVSAIGMNDDRADATTDIAAVDPGAIIGRFIVDDGDLDALIDQVAKTAIEVGRLVAAGQ